MFVMRKKVIYCILVIVIVVVALILLVLFNNRKSNNQKNNETNTQENVVQSSNIQINSIDDIYKTKVAEGYKNIKDLSEDYSKDQAQLDNCFVVGAMVHNDYLYNEFMEKYNNKQDSFIRVVQKTKEDDAYIIDMLYDSKENKIYFVKDDTRDKMLLESERTIKFRTYEKTGIWNYQDRKYWVVYNHELPDGESAQYNLDEKSLYIIATIN